jgi:hypothetical protein
MRPALCALLLAASAALAAPPALDIPAEVRPVQGYARVSPKTDAVSVTYVSLDGLYPFPADELKDPRRFVLPVGGVKAGRYRYVAVAASKDGEQATAEFAVVVGDAPPGPTPPGPTPPDPAPVPVTTFRVVIVYESSTTLTAAQTGIIFGNAVETYLTARTTKDGQTAGWRRRDKDDAGAGDTAGMNALWAAAKPKVTSVPCLAIQVNDKITLEPLPATAAETVALLKRYAGDN